MADNDQDDLAAEWASALEGEGAQNAPPSGAGAAPEWNADDDAGSEAPSEPDSPGRILNQDEIDSLLGFNAQGEAGVPRTGIKVLINSARVSYERLPMLEIVFDRLVRMMTTSLRNFTSDNVEVSLDSITSVRFGEYLNSIPLPAILAVFRAEQWDNYGLFTVESNLTYSIVDVLLGGRRGTAAMRVEGRPYTTIEQSLVERMIEVLLRDMSAAFDPLAPVTCNLDRIETNPRFAVIARGANAGLLVRFRIDMEDRGGKLELILPYATLEPIRELLLQMFMGEKFGRDSIWEGHLASELWSTKLDIDAVLDEQLMPLREVRDLQVGQTILLNAGPQSEVELRSGSISLFKGRMGRKGKKVAVQVDRLLSRQERKDGQAG